jgi:hypothetical protein
MYNNFLSKPTNTQKFHKNSHTLFRTSPTLHENLVSRINRELFQPIDHICRSQITFGTTAKINWGKTGLTLFIYFFGLEGHSPNWGN